MTEHAATGPLSNGAEAAHLSDPRERILHSPMSRPQRQVVALTGALSALDGFDLLSITFVAPVLAREFGANSAAIGLLLSAGLLGALVGSVALAPIADILGRRPIVLISLGIMTSGMLVSAACTSIVWLAVVRVVTGIGIGAMVVVVNPIAVEVANQRMRSFALAMMSIGYPLGGAFGGLVAAWLLRHFDWRAVFLFGAAVCALVIPLVVRQLPESLAFLLERRRDNSLARVNDLMSRFGHPPLAVLPPAMAASKPPYREIFGGPRLPTTVRVCAVSLMVFLTIYFFLSWQPSMLVTFGFDTATAATISGTSSFAGALGCAVFAWASRRIDGRRLAIASILGLGACVIAFGCVTSSPVVLVVLALLAGGCVASATTGLYVITAEAFDPRVRATGTGLVIGVGRIGSALAPTIAGGLFALGGTRASVAAVLGGCAVLAAVLLLLPAMRRLRHR